MLELGFKGLMAYLLGSVIGSLVVGRLRGGVDIRTQGSGNAGGTNALRTQGLPFAAWVMLIDVVKGIVAVTVIPSLSWPVPDPVLERDWLAVTCGFLVVLGHVYPVWHEFRGGKGAATFVGVVLGLQPLALLPMLAVWLGTVVLTGFVGLATVLAGFTLPVWLWGLGASTREPMLLLAVAIALFVVFTHRSNLARMRQGTEGRAQRLWLLRPR